MSDPSHHNPANHVSGWLQENSDLKDPSLLHSSGASAPDASSSVSSPHDVWQERPQQVPSTPTPGCPWPSPPTRPAPTLGVGNAVHPSAPSQQVPPSAGEAREFHLIPPPALDASTLVKPVLPAPKSGWRKVVHSVTGGRINPGESSAVERHEELLRRARQPLRGDYRIAILSLKGGVGKTTTTVALGSTFASVRGDRVIAVDANPDFGTLAQRVAAPPQHATIRDLLAAEDTSRYPLVRAFTTQAPSRLEVIGSERDPAASEAFSEDDYRRAIDILQHHYNVILTDCGTGLMHSAMNGVLELANSLVLVTSSALDGAQSASATLDWLNLHGFAQLAANAVVAINESSEGRSPVDMEQLTSYFRSRTRAVHVIPFDRHLSEGANIDLERMSRHVRNSYLELAAIVADDFNSWHKHAKSR